MNSLSSFDVLQISTVMVALNIDTKSTSPVKVGAQLTQIDFEDKQRLPNHVHLDTGFAVMGG